MVYCVLLILLGYVWALCTFPETLLSNNVHMVLQDAHPTLVGLISKTYCFPNWTKPTHYVKIVVITTVTSYMYVVA